MLHYLKTLSTHRGGWFLLLCSALVLEAVAFYFQHGMGLAPCVMCIYERVALFGIAFAGLFGLFLPNLIVFRLLALLIGGFSAVKGIALAVKHIDYQTNPGPWNQCSYIVEFPRAFPLDKWFPSLFEPSGSCSEIPWQFLGLSMAQWILFIFASYTLLFVVLFISQFKRTPNIYSRSRRIFK